MKGPKENPIKEKFIASVWKSEHPGGSPVAANADHDPNNRIMQNMMKTFHRAMKIRKYRKLSRNSLMLSPVVGALDSSPNPCDSFLLSLKFSTAPALTSKVLENRQTKCVSR